MLDFIRRGIKSWVAKLLLGLLIVSFAVWGIGDVFTSSEGGTVAKVGETEVTGDEFARRIVRQQRLIAQQSGQFLQLDDLRAADIDDQIIASLVREASYQAELTELDIAVPEDAVREIIAANPAFQDGGGNFSQFAYQSAIGQQGYSPQYFERITRDLIGQQIISDAITVGVQPPPGMGSLLTQYDGEERRIATIRIPLSEAPEPAAPSDAELTGYHAENGEDFREPERRWGTYLHADALALAATMTIEDADVRAAYDEDISAYVSEARRTVEQIVFENTADAEAAIARLTSGEASFAEIAAEEDVALSDLSLGSVVEGELAPASSDAVFALTEPGIAGPVDGPFGTIVFNVTRVTLGGQQPFEEVEAQIRTSLAMQSANRAVNDRVTQIDDLRASGASMEEIADETGLALISFQGLAANGTVAEGDIPGLALDPRFIQEMQSAGIGEEREIAEMTDGSYALVMISRVAESHIPPMADIRDTVADAWAIDQRLNQLEQRAAGLIATGGANLAAVATEAGQTVADRVPFPRAVPPTDLEATLVEAIFDSDVGDVVVGRATSGDAVIVGEVREIIPIAPDRLSQTTSELEGVLAESVARDQLEYFARTLEQRHGSFTYPDSIDAVFDRLGMTGGF